MDIPQLAWGNDQICKRKTANTIERAGFVNLLSVQQQELSDIDTRRNCRYDFTRDTTHVPQSQQGYKSLWDICDRRAHSGESSAIAR